MLREAFVAAQNYQAKQAAAKKDKKPFDARDLKLEALAMVLDREIPWRQHSHRADDIATAMRIADEFGYELVIDHGTEAHLIADLIAAKGIPVLIGPLIVSRTKVEVRNRSTVNPGLLAKAGVEISIITDHPVCPIGYLVLQATLAVRDGLDPETAMRAITINPARVLGLDDRIGSLEVGKLGDLAIWSGDPLDVMQRAHRVFIEGEQVYAWSAPKRSEVDGRLPGGAAGGRPRPGARVLLLAARGGADRPLRPARPALLPGRRARGCCSTGRLRRPSSTCAWTTYAAPSSAASSAAWSSSPSRTSSSATRTTRSGRPAPTSGWRSSPTPRATRSAWSATRRAQS